MTDLLSVEDIKKALGAFAGEHRPPSPASPASPVLYPHPPPWPLPLSVPCIPSGAPGVGGGGAGGEWESSARPKLLRAGLGSVGKPCDLPRPPETWGHRRLGGPAGRAGVPTKVEDRGPWPGTSPLGAQEGLQGGRACLLTHPLPRPPLWTGLFPPGSGEGLAPLLSKPPAPRAQRPLQGAQSEVTFLELAPCSALPCPAGLGILSAATSAPGRPRERGKLLSSPGLQAEPPPSHHPDGETEAGRVRNQDPALTPRSPSRHQWG